MMKKRGRPSHAELNGSPTPAEIKASRFLVNLSREDAAEALSVSSRTWTRWENGEGKMHPDAWTTWKAYISGEPAQLVEPLASDLRELRDAAGLTQGEAAKLMDVPINTWHRWERGGSAMHPAQFQRWCNGLETLLEERLKRVRALIAKA